MPPVIDLRAEFLACLGFYTRLPMPGVILPRRGMAAAQWAAPLAGMVVALSAWLVWQAGATFGLSSAPAAALALAATMLITGCLHEDGLTDTADGFGGGRTRERKLDIMRDSRIGTFGAAALGLSILLRWSALAEMHNAATAFAAVVAAHTASRALIPAFLLLLPPARADGLSAGVGAVKAETAAVAGLFGVAAILLLGIGAATAAIIVLAIVFFTFRRLCLSQIGGHTGDTLGALQQLGEIAVLLVAAASF